MEIEAKVAVAGVNVLLGLGRLRHAKEPQEKDYRGTTDAQQELPGIGASVHCEGINQGEKDGNETDLGRG